MTTRTKETRQDTQVTLWPKMMLLRVADAHLGSFRNANSRPTQALHRGPEVVFQQALLTRGKFEMHRNTVCGTMMCLGHL